jgi:D-alanyl-D-alanine carboxypeptidase
MGCFFMLSDFPYTCNIDFIFQRLEYLLGNSSTMNRSTITLCWRDRTGMFTKTIKLLICIHLLVACVLPVAFAEEKQPSSPLPDLAPNASSAVTMDVDSGTVIFEKNKDAKLPPASITKIMTMLLIMEALDQGKIKMDEKVRTSEYAASMGGSQIFLESGEEMTVQDMLKGIAMASGNDASVAMAEKLAGSEQAFVQMITAMVCLPTITTPPLSILP